MYVCWIAFEFTFCYFFVIETKNRTLEETAALFDGEDAVEQISGHVGGTTGVVRDDSSDEKGYDSYVPAHELGRA